MHLIIFGGRTVRSVMERCRSILLEEAEENKFTFKGKIKEKGVRIMPGCLIGKDSTQEES